MIWPFQGWSSLDSEFIRISWSSWIQYLYFDKSCTLKYYLIQRQDLLFLERSFSMTVRLSVMHRGKHDSLSPIKLSSNIFLCRFFSHTIIYSVNILSVCMSVMLQKALLLMDVVILVSSVFYQFWEIFVQISKSCCYSIFVNVPLSDHLIICWASLLWLLSPLFCKTVFEHNCFYS